MAIGAILLTATPHYQIWRTPIGAPPAVLPIRHSRSPAASHEVTSANPTHSMHFLIPIHQRQRRRRPW